MSRILDRCRDGSGWRKVIEAGSTRGYSEIISVAEIVERKCGFLSGDSFVLQLGLRLSIPENESLAVAACGNTRICTVRPVLSYRAPPIDHCV